MHRRKTNIIMENQIIYGADNKKEMVKYNNSESVLQKQICWGEPFSLTKQLFIAQHNLATLSEVGIIFMFFLLLLFSNFFPCCINISIHFASLWYIYFGLRQYKHTISYFLIYWLKAHKITFQWLFRVIFTMCGHHN